MLRANIFQENTSKKSIKTQEVLNYDNCLVDISEKKLKILNNNQIILNTNLNKIEEDFNTTSYVGLFTDGTKFRVIRPNKIPLANLQNEFNCISAFTIASVNPDGYAIHFILTEKDDIREMQSKVKGVNEQIQKLLDGCLMALNNEMHDTFIDLSKRIIKLIDSGDELKHYNFGNETLEIIKNNIDFYSIKERVKINHSS